MSDFTTQQQQITSEGEGKNTAVTAEAANGAPAAETGESTLTFTPAQQAHLDRVIEDRLARQRTQYKRQEEELKAKAEAQRLAEQGEFKMLAEQRQTRIAELETELQDREMSVLRATAAAKHKLPEHWIARLVGTTEAELNEDAARIAKDLAPPKAPNAEGGERHLSNVDARARAIQEAKQSGKYAA